MTTQTYFHLECFCAFLIVIFYWFFFFDFIRRRVARARRETGPLLAEIKYPPPYWTRKILFGGALLYLAIITAPPFHPFYLIPIHIFGIGVLGITAIFPWSAYWIALEIRERGIVLPNSSRLPYAFWREIRWCRWLKAKNKLSIRAADILVEISMKAKDLESAMPLLGRFAEVQGDDLQMLFPGPDGPALTDAEITSQKAVLRGRRFQFDLRSMLLLTLLVASGSGWYVVNREHLRIRKQTLQQALDGLEPFKAQIAFDGNSYDEVGYIDFSKSPRKFTDQDMVLLKPFSRVFHLNLNNTAITDQSLPDLKEFGWLIWLDLKGTNITPEGIERLRKEMPQTTIDY